MVAPPVVSPEVSPPLTLLPPPFPLSVSVPVPVPVPVLSRKLTSELSSKPALQPANENEPTARKMSGIASVEESVEESGARASRVLRVLLTIFMPHA